MRWTSRTTSQRQSRTKWVAPDLDRISRKRAVLSQYSSPDYLLGGSTEQGLQEMAWRLQFGEPEPQAKSPSLPELPAYERALSREFLSSKVLARELEGDAPYAELADTSGYTFQFCPPSRPQRPSIPFIGLTPTDATSETSPKASEDLPNNEAPSEPNEGCKSHDLSDDLFDLYYH